MATGRSEPEARTPPSRREWLTAAVVMSLLALLLFNDVWLRHRATLASPGGDSDLFLWYLGWMPWALAHGHDPFVTEELLAPAGANLMPNTSILLPALLLSPLTVLAGPIASFNLLTTAAPALSGLCAWRALREHAGAAGALAGGVLYGFSPVMSAQARLHPHMTLAVFPPVAYLLLRRICLAERRGTRRRAGLLLGLAGVAQLLTGTEILALTVIAAAVGLALAAVLHRDRVAAVRARLIEALAPAVVAALILGAIPVAILLRGPQHVDGVLQPTDTYVEDVVSLVVPGGTLVAGTDHAHAIVAPVTGNALEASGYLGIPLLVVVVIGVVGGWRRRDRMVLWASAVGAVLTVLALGPHLHVGGRVLGLPLPWFPLGRSGLLASLLPGRLMLIVFLALGLSIARTVDAVITAGSARRVAYAALLLVTTASLVSYPVPGSTPVVDPWFTSGTPGVRADSLVLLSPVVDPYGYTAMRDQAVAGFPFRITTGGAYVPGPVFGPPADPLNRAFHDAENQPGFAQPGGAALALLQGALAASPIDAVVVASQPLRDQVVALAQAIIGRPPTWRGGVAIWVLRP